MEKCFRIFDFNVYNEEKTNTSQSYEETDKVIYKDKKVFTIQMFGINEQGRSCAIFVEGFTPFFYIKVGDDWTKDTMAGFIEQIKEDISKSSGSKNNERSKYWDDSIVDNKLIRRKKLYGFDNGREYKFVRIDFKNTTAFNKVKDLWFTGKRDKYLKRGGYQFAGVGTQIYESNIPPLLRLFHIKEISPSGWIALPNKKTEKRCIKTTTCNYEYNIPFTSIIPLNKKETPVPYKICSFDIEANSSHGDFPLPIKDYDKLARNIVDVYDAQHKSGTKMTSASVTTSVTETDTDKASQLLKRIIYTAFGYDDIDNVDKIYVKLQPTQEYLERLFRRWITQDIIISNAQDEDSGKSWFKKIDDDVDDVDDDDDGNIYKAKARLRCLLCPIEVLMNKGMDRKEKIEYILSSLNSTQVGFPKVCGDEVTFIGSTFMRYGEEHPYLNHCIALDTCSDLADVPNSVVESYNTEKKVLLAWTRIIQKENPDIVIGYNIFGFDYEFMFRRALENNCADKFLMLSRNKNAACWKEEFDGTKKNIDTTSIKIASGQHDLKFIKMPGRLQVDLYNYFRRDFNLSSYKLDSVAGHFIGDGIKKIEYIDDVQTKVYSGNLSGLQDGNYICFEETGHSSEYYKEGAKFIVHDVNKADGTYLIDSIEKPDMTKKVRWCLAKDDVTPQDIFRLTKEGPDERAIIAKYCIQDCNLVHHLMKKIDVITGFIEVSTICSVPMNFLVMRGQGIKLTSYIAKKCREKKTLMPVIDKGRGDESYEGAIVLKPKCGLYLEDPVACVDYGSLYPSCMISENLSHDSKVWTREYDLNGREVRTTGEQNRKGEFIYDNLPDYKYVDVKYDTYKWVPNKRGKMEKTICGHKICRFAQFPNHEMGIMPSILKELLSARKATRKLIPQQTDDFMKNVLDKRQLGYKITANSLYGQCGAKTSTFYEVDVAASTTATGRKLLIYGKEVIERVYGDRICDTDYGKVQCRAEYVYGDTDSIFFKFNLEEITGEKIKNKKALEITIKLAQEVGQLATKFLKAPHDLEYEKTFMPFCLLSKKRYVGMLYETDPEKCKRASMGIVLKRRDNAAIVKDVYGGIIDILMNEKNVESAIVFLKQCLDNIVKEKYPLEKLIVTKALRGNYKNPKQIAHKVLADRMGQRDPGNKPSVGDRIPYVYIHNKDKKALQGERIEHPQYIRDNKIKPNYSFYITNQIMKPVQQVFALVLLEMTAFRRKKQRFACQIETLRHSMDEDKYEKKVEDLKNKEVKALLFDEFLRSADNMQKGNQTIQSMFAKM